MFDNVRDDVPDATGRRQQPFSYGSISGRQDFLLCGREIGRITRASLLSVFCKRSRGKLPRHCRKMRSIFPSMSEHDHDHHDHSELSEMELRVRALETVLTEKGYVEPKALDAIVQAYETKIGPHNGARVVAKAWVDPEFKRALLADATKAVGTLGHVSRVGDHLVAVENTPTRHNMVVCTLCSCYPWEMLGLPPVWYKAAPYRSRAVKDPRGVLKDFGVSLPADTEIRVWDSTAETRFLVLPMRPKGTEGFSEEQLAELVTRDSMIGTGFPKAPGAPS
jgi:nitrile hydratase